MLAFKSYLYEITAIVDGWQMTKTIESETTLPKNEIKRLGYDLFGLHAKLIGFKMRTFQREKWWNADTR